jgi:CRISPR/Cas system-associated exonuclease Cas4 (RecB family)
MSRVSHSEVEGYLLCRRKHYYGYTLGLQPRKVSAALSQGIAGHEVLEALYAAILDGKTFDEAVSIAWARFDELVAEGYVQDEKRADLRQSLALYFANEPLVKEGWTILSVEQEFVLEYDNTDPEDPKQFPFKVDIIAKDPNGKVVVVDHKFTYDFAQYADTALQPQIAKYIGALRGLNHKVDYGAYNQIRTRKIVGLKSKAAPTGAGPTLEQALMFLPIKPNGIRVARTFQEQIDVATELQALKALPLEHLERTAFRTANKMICVSCNFKSLCDSDNTGANSQLLTETDYQVRERKQFAAEASEDAE